MTGEPHRTGTVRPQPQLLASGNQLEARLLTSWGGSELAAPSSWLPVGLLAWWAQGLEQRFWGPEVGLEVGLASLLTSLCDGRWGRGQSRPHGRRTGPREEPREPRSRRFLRNVLHPGCWPHSWGKPPRPPRPLACGTHIAI